MKQTLTFVFRSILFVLIFLLILSASASVFLPKNNAPEDGMHNHKQNSFLGESPNSLDVVILGNSLAMCGFSPMDIWEGYGITAQNCASGDQVLYQARDYLREVFQYHSPKVVILEPDIILNSSTFLQRVQYTAECYFPTLRYHDRWKILRFNDFSSKPDYTYTDDQKGYHFESDIVPSKNKEYMVFSQDRRAIWEKNLGYMDEIVQLCRENHAQLIFVSVPSSYCWNYSNHNTIEDLASELNVSYLDLNLTEIGIDWDMDTYDYGNHLNHTGAQKVSAYIGQYLTDTGLFTDKRESPEYASWNEALVRFRESIAS